MTAPDYRDPAEEAVAQQFQCSPVDPTRACEARHEAFVKRDFWATLWGWYRLEPNRIAGPFTHCPWCSGKLPVLTGKMLDAMDVGRYEGEDGG